MPFAVVGANAMVDVRGKKIRGRLYPWGVIEVENPAHCDFVKLRTMLITHMQDMQEVTHFYNSNKIHIFTISFFTKFAFSKYLEW